MNKRRTDIGSLLVDRRRGFVDRLAAEELGDDVGAAAHRQEGLLADPRGLDGDVDRRVADPEDEDALADQDVGLAVVVDVDLLARELLRAGEGRFGPARVPVVAVGDEDGAVALRAPLAGGILEGDLPLPVDGHRRDHFGAEGDPLAQAEALDVVVEVLGDLPVAGVVGVVGRHREGAVGHQLAGAVDVQRAVGGGLTRCRFRSASCRRPSSPSRSSRRGSRGSSAPGRR